MSDFISSIIGILRQQFPDITPETAKKLEHEISKQWGGGFVYIGKHNAVINGKIETIIDCLKAGRSISQIEYLHGIPKTTIYRLINKHRGQSCQE
jgi:Mor family transcriptional regulator